MTIEYETIFPRSRLGPIITEIFERGGFQNRDQEITNCFESVVKFYSKIFDEFSLILINVVIEDTKLNSHRGVWKCLKEQFKIDLPNGIRSEGFRKRDGELIYTCKIEVPIQNIHLALEVLNQFKNSLLIFGDCSEDKLSLDHILNITEKLHYSDPTSWQSLTNYLSEKGLIGMRVFGLFDDLENGLIVYEPLSFFQKYSDWHSR